MMQMGEVHLEKEKVYLDITRTLFQGKEGVTDSVAVNVTGNDEDKVVPLLDPIKIQSEGQNCEDNNSCVQDAEAIEDSSRKHPGAIVNYIFS